MTQPIGSNVEVFEGPLPEGYHKFQVILSGNVDGELSFFCIGKNEAQVGGYAQELADKMRYSEVAISSDIELEKRLEDEYEGYEFSFPEPENSVYVKAPDWGKDIPTAVVVLDEATVAGLFDKDARAKRERQQNKEKREQRRGRTSALGTQKA